MSVQVIYESMFGNTHVVAAAVTEGLRDGLRTRGLDVPVHLTDVSQAPWELPGDTTLVVLGGPTHAFSMSRPSTRADALQQTHEHDAARAGIGIREWIDRSSASATMTVVTFDTRVKKRFVPGSAAKSAAKALTEDGFDHVERGETFWVADTPGPLLDGEADRARAWGVELAARVPGAAPAS